MGADRGSVRATVPACGSGLRLLRRSGPPLPRFQFRAPWWAGRVRSMAICVPSPGLWVRSAAFHAGSAPERARLRAAPTGGVNDYSMTRLSDLAETRECCLFGECGKAERLHHGSRGQARIPACLCRDAGGVHIDAGRLGVDSGRPCAVPADPFGCTGERRDCTARRTACTNRPFALLTSDFWCTGRRGAASTCGARAQSPGSHHALSGPRARSAFALGHLAGPNAWPRDLRSSIKSGCGREPHHPCLLT